MNSQPTNPRLWQVLIAKLRGVLQSFQLFTLALLLISLTSGCLMRAKSGEPALVGGVHVQGNQGLKSDLIRKRIALTTSGRKILFEIGERHTFEPDLIPADRKRIERLYGSMGYHSARVLDVSWEEVEGRVEVTFVVEEGPRSIMVSRDIRGLEELDEELVARLLKDLPLEEGAPFSEADHDTIKSELIRRLRAEGYAEASLESEVRVDRKKARVEAKYELSPGMQYRVSRVHVFGAKTISSTRVSDAAYVKAGALYTPKLVSGAQRRVYDMGVFSLVQVEPGPFNRRNGTVPLVITITEAPYQTVEAGAGLEADPSRQLAKARVGYTHRNIARGLQRLNLDGAIGYAFLPHILAPFTQDRSRHGIIADTQAEFTQPRVARLPFDISAAVDYSKDVQHAFSYQRAGARLGVPVHLPFWRELTILPSLNFEWYFDVRGAVDDEGVGIDLGSSRLAQSGCGTDEVECRIFFGQLLLNLDYRDDSISPRRGSFYSIATQLAGTGLSQFAYARVAPEMRQYVPLSSMFTLAGRARYGMLFQLGDRKVPGVKRFFSGGATSVRTEVAQGLGPVGFVAGEESVGRPAPVGGDRLLEGSLELRWRYENYGAALFFDAGALSLGKDEWIPGQWQYGPGIGLRYYTPFGPLRLDFAWRLSAASRQPFAVRAPKGASQDVGDYVIGPDKCASGSLTCYEESRFQFHLTLGEAF